MTLMENAEPIHKLFRQIINHLSPELVSLLTLAAFMESNYIQLEVNQLKAKEIKQQFNELVASSSDAEQSLKELETERDRLLQELNRINQEITTTKDWINNYPLAIQEKKKEWATFVNEACHQHHNLIKISGANKEDMKLIADVDQIRMHAIEALKKAL
uniref:Uncharacterized protein n=1 Tax=Setaria italica TaxID=4555 RepID=K3ZC30_SETIT